MEHKQRAKMPASQRAKQFMPFAAVKGLKKAIVEQEQLLNQVEQVELYEEKGQMINEELNHLEKGSQVSIYFYKDNRYQNLQGIVEQIDFARNLIRITGAIIPIKSIIELRR